MKYPKKIPSLISLEWISVVIICMFPNSMAFIPGNIALIKTKYKTMCLGIDPTAVL